MARVLSGYRHDVQLYPPRLATSVNWRLLAAFALNFAIWGGIASFLWGVTS